MIEVLDAIFKKLKDRRPITHEVNSQHYAVRSDGTLGEPIRGLAPQFTKPTLNLRTVSGLVAAFLAGLDGLPTADVAFSILSPTVVVIDTLKADDFGQRHRYAVATHVEDSGFIFGLYYSPEDFLIAFRAGFLFNDMAVKVQTLCSSLTAESGVTVADDGMSQMVTVRTGGVTRNAIELPPEIPLIPWRTFREVDPVESKFLLRMKAVKDQLPQIAIIEIDSKWKLDTVESIRHYIAAKVPDATIIA